MSVGPPGEPGGLFLYDEGDGEPAAGLLPAAGSPESVMREKKRIKKRMRGMRVV